MTILRSTTVVICLLIIWVSACKKLENAPTAKISAIDQKAPCTELLEKRNSLKKNLDFLKQEDSIAKKRELQREVKAGLCESKSGRWKDEKCVCEDGIVLNLEDKKETCKSSISFLEALNRQCEAVGGIRINGNCVCADGTTVDPTFDEVCAKAELDEVTKLRNECNKVKNTYWSVSATACYCDLSLIDPFKTKNCAKSDSQGFEEGTSHAKEISELAEKLRIAEKKLIDCDAKYKGRSALNYFKPEPLPTGCVCGPYKGKCMIWIWEREYDHAESFSERMDSCGQDDCNRLLEMANPKNCNGKIERYYKTLEGLID